MINLLKAKSEFRKKGVTLVADKQKTGGGGSWRFVSEDSLIKTIQKPLIECGLEYIPTLEADVENGINIITVTLFHIESGESISSKKILPTPNPKKDSKGNPMYLDAEIEAGKQFGYWSRILAMRLLGLSDLDPETMEFTKPKDLTRDTAKELEDIKKNIDKSDLKSVKSAKAKAAELYSYETDAEKKEAIRAFGVELKEILEGSNEANKSN